MEQISVALSTEKPLFVDREQTARFGLIVLATDLTSEGDFYRQLPARDVAVHVARVAYENPTTPENLRKMTPRLAESASLLAATGPLRAVCYSCTAASVVIGDQTVRSAIQLSLPDVPVVTPTHAARQALSAFGVKKLAVLTPYTVATSEPMAHYFRLHGLEIVRFECLGVDDDRDMARISDETIINAAIAADHEDAQALFISCTALPVVGLIGEIEERIGKPVVTSNQASVWAMTRVSGLANHSPQGFGSLFRQALPAQNTS
ncbi:MAG: aspartate/glutamate racemase family protein [Alphaproteobacteria bacterium]|nr:aspartate/glutamate racemase family protein [Alphaproteobacteria bacterium]